jgi:hypothetical protein
MNRMIVSSKSSVVVDGHRVAENLARRHFYEMNVAKFRRRSPIRA